MSAKTLLSSKDLITEYTLLSYTGIGVRNKNLLNIAVTRNEESSAKDKRAQMMTE